MGHSFETCKTKNIWNVKICGNGSTIAKHVWSFYHCIDFENSNVIDKGYFRIRKTLEAWHTSATKNADNNSRLIPNHYSILFKKIVSYCNGHISTLPLFLLLLLSHQFCMYFTVFAFHYSLVKGCISTAESSCHHLKGYFVLGLKIVIS